MVRVGPYELGATLGRGNYGLVKLAVNRDTGEQFAVKIVKKEALDDDRAADVDIKREIAIMKALDHTNIVALNDVLYSPKRVFMVMELVRGGELFESIVKHGRQDEKTARRYFHQLIDAVHYCHHRGVYHRDLKPENLLLGENGELKITDFGFSAMRDYGAHLLHTNCGSPHYCAPEVWNGTQDGYDGRKNDAWSCGIILYVMLTGKQPFYDDDDEVLLEKVSEGVVEYPDYLSEGARELIERLLEMDPRKRFSLSKVKRHPWFAVGYDAEKDALLRQQEGRKERARLRQK
ncbi:Serine/threnine protein kinase [Chondrus crispus]|uniref:non-specific serine/threonine protein kinase n=1 Tax=Chondrus crispus TaxID=2769 RepID=R7QA21_CHOCR|nr:Serine/threnine protein kinase [Chondrus crispus]CDF34320.1 Serine/threnine protein kinase [Chondrus crispus]|eukprot:XP_005714139.1 Serine/threnine protein kinase [Chondrus crispus]